MNSLCDSVDSVTMWSQNTFLAFWVTLMRQRWSVVSGLAVKHWPIRGTEPSLYSVMMNNAMTSGNDTLCLQRWQQAYSLNVLCKSSQKNEIFMMEEAVWDWTLHPVFLLLHNEYAYGRVCVCASLCVLMCVVVCELSQTPPDLCLRRLISAVHKGALCALQDRLSGQWIHCLTTPSPTQANWYEPLSSEIIGSSVFLH